MLWSSGRNPLFKAVDDHATQIASIINSFMLDDLSDVDEDTRRGRWNYVSALTRQLKSLASLQSCGAEIFSLPQEEFFLRRTVLLEMHSHLGKARSVLDSLALQEGLQYLDRYTKKIGSFVF